MSRNVPDIKEAFMVVLIAERLGEQGGVSSPVIQQTIHGQDRETRIASVSK